MQRSPTRSVVAMGTRPEQSSFSGCTQAKTPRRLRLSSIQKRQAAAVSTSRSRLNQPLIPPPLPHRS